MRILNLMLARGRGGLEGMARRYHEALTAEGFEVLSVGHAKGLLAETVRPAQFAPLNSGFTGDPLAALTLKGLAKRFKADLILAHGNRAIALAGHPFAGSGAKTLGVVHNFRFKPTLTRVRAAIAVSPAVHEAIRARYPRLETHLLENFTPLVMHPVKTFPLDAPRIGSLGRLHVNKGFDVLIRAASVLRDRGTDVSLVIAGDGPEKEALNTLIADLRLEDRVALLGWIEPPDGFLASLDLFVLSSRVEPFGLVVAEAMAAGAPIVSTRIDGPRHILRDGELAGMVPPEDPQALADAIEAVAKDWLPVLDRACHAQAHALETYGLIAGHARLKSLINRFQPEN
ncbi:glycosyltransferase [Asticcacaulis sp. AND118]|uniref:glycosyltransferase n=1 Tax=Asticcacaulis sp. AND118 TaxID=2840468 RepID=UPI001CFF85B8|nr:glycosyltransferase [Asticcacaulis sp. AND118]UDF03952.1 glycosyltransferase [Asticcacaulis sp. AND118]